MNAVLLLLSFVVAADDTPNLDELYEKAAKAQLKTDIQNKIRAIKFEETITFALKNAKPDPNHKGGVAFTASLSSPMVLTYRGTQEQLKPAMEENEKQLKKLAEEKAALGKLTAVTPRLEAHFLKDGTIGIPYCREEPMVTKVVEVVDASRVRVNCLGKPFLVKTPTDKLKKGDSLKIDFVVYVRKSGTEVILERFTPKGTNR